MKARLYPIAVPILLALAACQPGVASYTESEAPNYLTVNSAASQVDLRFVPGSARLLRHDAARLRRLAEIRAIRPADRVMVVASGGPGLAQRRADTVSRMLMRYGIVTVPGTYAALPPNHAVVEVGRYTVSLPPCPNWSKPSLTDFSNTLSSNYGCSTMTNLGLMVASPADLVSGVPVGYTAGPPAIGAVDRYLSGTVTQPTSAAGLSTIGGTAGGTSASNTATAAGSQP